jgi:hypothetical protein
MYLQRPEAVPAKNRTRVANSAAFEPLSPSTRSTAANHRNDVTLFALLVYLYVVFFFVFFFLQI